ncbi:MAG TPA: nucleoside recognition domain-containing protein [Verrucomicrobiae bacterium]|nr:nucleoside recognition domain-containing protein [Verrucomicrobiae bacterium]
MLNYIWLGLILLAVIIGGCNHQLKEVTDKAFEMAEFAVMKTALPLVGIMALWLGIMRLAERAGLVAMFARALRPLLRWLFPDVPPEHPAMGSMVLNIAAGILGLGNAATPLGLRAMKDLESLNPHPGTATNSMCTFLAINTSSIQLIPATAIAILAANGSTNPTAIVGTSIIATTCAAISGVTAAKLLQHLPVFRTATPATPNGASNLHAQSAAAEISGPLSVEPPHALKWCGKLVLLIFFAFFCYLFIRLAFPALIGAQPQPDFLGQKAFIRIVNAVSQLSIPFLLAGFPLYANLRRVRIYEEFVEGAKEGFEVALKIIPYLVAILVAIGMFRAAGGIDLLSRALHPIMQAVGFPPDLLPMVLMRPLSGSGTLGMFAELVKQCGPDSLVSRMGGTVYGSTETTLYVLAVYFGAVGIKRTRHALLAGITADTVGVIASVIVCRAVFG